MYVCSMKKQIKFDDAEVLRAETVEALSLPVFDGLRAGFPSPAADYEHQELDFNRDFIKNKEATFYVRVRGDSMKDAGITDGDLCVVDKSVEPVHGNIVVARVNGGFTVKYLDTSTRDKGYVRLIAANENYKPYIVDASDEFIVWGKVIFTIKDWRNSCCLP